MSASQFTVYTSSDPGNGSDQPGLIFGNGGDLIRILDKCLVNGYTGKAAAGWTKPFVNVTFFNSVGAGTGTTGCYKEGAGTGFGVTINDNGPNLTAAFREAWATGWESITAVPGVGTVGTGTGQFPTPAQNLTTGHVVWRKSSTSDNTNGRQWVVFADSSTFYLFILTNDLASTYLGGGFGDIFSLKGASDAYRAFIYGRLAENSGAADALAGDWDAIACTGATASNVTGQWMARSFGGGGSSVQVARIGDNAKTANVSSASSVPALGNIQTPNGPDNSWYLSPIMVYETTALCIRGRMRGVYHVCHALATFADGQTFQGSNDFAGKSFQIVTKGGKGGYWAVETSATLETN